MLLDSEIDKRNAKTASVMARLSKKVWSNNQLTSNTKLQVYQACVLSTLLYGSESCTTYARQENCLESFHLHCLRRILGITWQDKVTNTAVLGRAGSHSIHLLLCQCRLSWLSHVHRMGDGRIPKNVLYGELATGQHPAGRLALRFKDVCKHDLKLADIDTATWEQIADDRSAWRSAVRKGVRTGEDKRNRLLEDKGQRRKEHQESLDSIQPSAFHCTTCNRDCYSRIGLVSHARRCPNQNLWPDPWRFPLSDKIDGCLLLYNYVECREPLKPPMYMKEKPSIKWQMRIRNDLWESSGHWTICLLFLFWWPRSAAVPLLSSAPFTSQYLPHKTTAIRL